MDAKSRAKIEKQYKQNFFKSPEMELLYEVYPDPWRLNVDGHERYYKILEMIEKHHANPINIIDVGCSEGFFTRALAQKYPQSTVFGIEISKTAVERAVQQKIRNDHYIVLDIGTQIVPVATPVDVIILGDVLYYLNNKEEVQHAITEIDRLVAPGGLVIMTEFPKTKKYSNMVGEKFSKIHESREIVHYKIRPIDGVPNSSLTYRLVVFKR